MSKSLHTVVLFHSTNHALRAEKVLVEAGVSCKLIPIPRRISSDCGVCIRIGRTDRETALRALETSGVEIEGIYSI